MEKDQTKNSLLHRRFKRGNCICGGGEGATDDDYESYRNPEKRPMTEEMQQVEQFQRKSSPRKDTVSQHFDNKDMLVYTYREGLSVQSENFRVIYVPINEGILEEFEGDMDKYKESPTYFTIGIYKEILANEYDILNQLRRDEYNNFDYDIGIAEFNVMAGSFAVFEALGIEETCDVSNSIFLPEYLQFLGINVLEYQVPEFKSSKPGDWENGIWQKNKEENEKEHQKTNKRSNYLFTETSAKLYVKLFNDNSKITKRNPSKLDVLFNKIKYHFINQHPLIKFDNFPKHNKFVYIGGILVEDNKLLTEGKQLVDNEYNCVILVTFGMVKSAMLSIKRIIEQVFSQFPKCYFYVRANTTSNFDNVTTNNRFMQTLWNALVQILNCDEEGNCYFNSKYTLAAEKMREDILQNYEHETMKDKFLGKF
uniref:glucuronosyltransferase n=1 Tax=Meloidogyne floridensis TaxID=298350 RepID=A0A915P9Q4_9BILA